MNKSELVDTVAARLTADHKSTAAILDTIVDVITRTDSAGGKVTLTGFGTFEAQTRAARRVRNPRTGDVAEEEDGRAEVPRRLAAEGGRGRRR